VFHEPISLLKGVDSQLFFSNFLADLIDIDEKEGQEVARIFDEEQFVNWGMSSRGASSKHICLLFLISPLR
jgi:hypothetical protein